MAKTTPMVDALTGTYVDVKLTRAQRTELNKLKAEIKRLECLRDGAEGCVNCGYTEYDEALEAAESNYQAYQEKIGMYKPGAMELYYRMRTEELAKKSLDGLSFLKKVGSGKSVTFARFEKLNGQKK